MRVEIRLVDPIKNINKILGEDCEIFSDKEAIIPLGASNIIITPIRETIVVKAKADFLTPNLTMPVDDICDKIDRIREDGLEVSRIVILLPKGFLYGVPIEWKEEDGRENKD